MGDLGIGELKLHPVYQDETCQMFVRYNACNKEVKMIGTRRKISECAVVLIEINFFSLSMSNHCFSLHFKNSMLNLSYKWEKPPAWKRECKCVCTYLSSFKVNCNLHVHVVELCGIEIPKRPLAVQNCISRLQSERSRLLEQLAQAASK